MTFRMTPPPASDLLARYHLCQTRGFTACRLKNDPFLFDERQGLLRCHSLKVLRAA